MLSISCEGNRRDGWIGNVAIKYRVCFCTNTRTQTLFVAAGIFAEVLRLLFAVDPVNFIGNVIS